jgi:hypothetical protein
VKLVVEKCMIDAFKSILPDVESKVDIDIRDTWDEKIDVVEEVNAA